MSNKQYSLYFRVFVKVKYSKNLEYENFQFCIPEKAAIIWGATLLFVFTFFMLSNGVFKGSASTVPSVSFCQRFLENLGD